MRPVSIVRFEQAYLASIALWLLHLVLSWGDQMAAVEVYPAAQGNPQVIEIIQWFLIAVYAAALLLWVLLWYFTARRASAVAKWLVVLFFAFSALSLLSTVPGVMAGAINLVSIALTALMFVLHAAAIWMLFRADARAWFNRTPQTPA